MKIGNLNTLMAVRETENGIYLEDKTGQEVLLPNRYVPQEWEQGCMMEVFVYTDSEDRLVATTETPRLMVGEVATLEVVGATRIGAFVDWGLPKDLLVPHSNQFHPLRQGDRVVVYAYLDTVTNRVVGTLKLGKYISNEQISVKVGEEVKVIVTQKKDIGYRVVINSKHWGLIYTSQIFSEVNVGDEFTAWVTKITEDNRIDLSLQQRGFEQVKVAADAIVQLLEECEGVLTVGDKSDSGEIQMLCGMSKKVFKRAVGYLISTGKVEAYTDKVVLKK